MLRTKTTLLTLGLLLAVFPYALSFHAVPSVLGPRARGSIRTARSVCLGRLPLAMQIKEGSQYNKDGTQYGGTQYKNDVKGKDNALVHLYEPLSREEEKERMKTEHFDILVIGGGATGAGVTMDAATRGMKVALVEKDDFASGTSSRSTKLIHGGLRYLALAFQKKIPPSSPLDVLLNLRYDHSMMQVVSHDLYERSYMIKSAPFLTSPLPLLIPINTWWEVPMMWVTGKLYDFIAGDRRTVPESHFITKDEALYQFPLLDKERLKGAIIVYDGQQNDTRMALTITLTAAQYGASVLNHAEVTELLTEGIKGTSSYKVVGAKVRDTLTGETWDIKAKQVIGAGGPFTDRLRKMADDTVDNIIVPAKGSHLVLPDHFSPEKMGCVWFTKDGRVLYLLPWEGSTIAGTTDLLEEVTEEPKCTPEEVDFILKECESTLDTRISPKDVRSAWAGLRPLVRAPGSDPGDTKNLARDHVVDVVAGNLITICGGKWTTYRKMAEDTVNKALKINPELRPKHFRCQTASMKLIGADRGGAVCGQSFEEIVVRLREEYQMDKNMAKHLTHNYGTRALLVADIAETLAKDEESDRHRRLFPRYPMIEAEVIFSCREEYACKAVDVLARRTRLAFLDSCATEAALPRVLELMQKELGWDDARVEEERSDVMRYLEQMRTATTPGVSPKSKPQKIPINTGSTSQPVSDVTAEAGAK